MGKNYLYVGETERDVVTHIYVEDGVRKVEKVRFKPFVGVETSKETGWKDIHNRNLQPRTFDCISDLRKWKKENDGVIDVYGDMPIQYQFIAANYRGKIEIDKRGMNIYNFDIEVISEFGFPKPEDAAHPISAITIQEMVTNKYTSFAYKPLKRIPDGDVTFIQCADERDLFNRFLKFLQDNPAGIFTGWNTKFFDIPYIVHRGQKIVGNAAISRISPLGKLTKHENQDTYGNISITYTVHGVADYDYKELYDKFNFEPRESYSLDFIAKVELGEEKLKFKENHEDLWSLYHNDFETYMQYNVRDVELVYLLDQKLGFINLALTMAYKAKCQLEDIYGTVKIWDSMLYNELLDRKMFCPVGTAHQKQEYPGGYVENPKVGMHKWVMVFDVASSYPNSIVSYNMSPETLVDDGYLPDELLDLRAKYIQKEWDVTPFLDQDKLKADGLGEKLAAFDVCMAPNGHFFRTDIEGFIPEVVYRLFNERKAIKKEMKERKKAGATAEELASLDANQQAIKISMNSLYGAMANVYFRYYDIRMASGITMAGQTSVRGVTQHIEKRVPLLKNIYNDTDSCFVTMEAALAKRFPNGVPDLKTATEFCVKMSEQVIEPTIAEFFEMLKVNLNLRRLTLTMEAECVSDICFFLAKKKYAMHQTWVEGTWYLDKDKLKIKGIEIVRTSTPQFCRDALKKCVGLIFSTGAKDEVIAYVKEAEKQFNELPFQAVAFPRGCNGLEKYAGQEKGVPIHVRAALLYNRKLQEMNLSDSYKKISEGDKIKFAYVKMPNRFQTDVIAAFDKLPEEFGLEVDRKAQWEKTFVSPISSIMDALGWQLDAKQTSLEDFFG